MDIPEKEDRLRNADEIGQKMYGSNWFKIIAGINKIDSSFATFIREIPYGSVYPREGLSLNYREIAAISVLTQLNLKPQLKSHLIAALNCGIKKEEIVELFLHLSMFIGFPLCLDGLKVAYELFTQRDQ